MVLDVALRVFEIISVSYGSVWLSKYLERKGRKRESDMDTEFIRKRAIFPILEDIRYQLDADRVFETVFSNGDTTFTGHHMKKLSIIAEVNREGLPDIGHHFQFIPTKKFDRILDELYESPEDYVITDETKEHDDLANLKKMFKLNYTLVVKIRDSIGRWVGNVSVGFIEPREFTDSEISYVKTQASRIGGLK